MDPEGGQEEVWITEDDGKTGYYPAVTLVTSQHTGRLNHHLYRTHKSTGVNTCHFCLEPLVSVAKPETLNSTVPLRLKLSLFYRCFFSLLVSR